MTPAGFKIRTSLTVSQTP